MSGSKKRDKREPRVWIYLANGAQAEYLAEVERNGGTTWGANPNTCRGDLIVMYRSAPYSDLAYVLVAATNAKSATNIRGWPWEYSVELADCYQLNPTLPLGELKRIKSLQTWGFLKSQQGMMRHHLDLVEKGVWPRLRQILESRDGSLGKHLRAYWKGPSYRRRVFLSYAWEDKRKVTTIYDKLSANRLDVWMDEHDIGAAEAWEERIAEGIRASHAVIICISDAWTKSPRNSYVKKEYRLAADLARRLSPRLFLFPVIIDDSELPAKLEQNAIFMRTGKHDETLRALAQKIRLLWPR
jgi:hypothetical protein